MEEIKKAEYSMTTDQKRASLKRENVFNRLETDFGILRDIEDARKLKIPEEKIKEFALRFIEADFRRGYSPESALEIAKKTGILSKKEALDLANQTHAQMLAENPANDHAAEETPKNWKITGKGINAKIILNQDATLADLYSALDSDEDDEDNGLNARFWSEIVQKFGKEFSMALQERIGKDVTIKLIDFFQQYGHGQKDLTTSLPLSFKKKRK